MRHVKGQLADAYTTPQPEVMEDDLSFLRSIIETKPAEKKQINIDLLKRALKSREPEKTEKMTGIADIGDYVKGPTRGPKFYTGRPETLSSMATFANNEEDDIPVVESSSGIVRERKISPNTHRTSPRIEAESRKAKEPSSYLSWKYLGVTDGVLGTWTGRIEATKTPKTLSREFAEIPYKLDEFKIQRGEETPQTKQGISKSRLNDLFDKSISPDSRMKQKQRTITTLRKFRRGDTDSRVTTPPGPKYDIYIETDTKMVPLKASRLH